MLSSVVYPDLRGIRMAEDSISGTSQEPRQGASAPKLLMIQSGSPNPELPHRYGCSCGAIWNASAPLEGQQSALCGPYCSPRLFALKEGS